MDNLSSIMGSTTTYSGQNVAQTKDASKTDKAANSKAANNYGKDSRHVIVNGLNLDGIVAADPSKGIEGTSLEPELYAAEGLMDNIAELSILKKLATVEEIAEWCYFLLVVNTVMTGQILCIDGELMGAYKFIPYPGWND